MHNDIHESGIAEQPCMRQLQPLRLRLRQDADDYGDYDYYLSCTNTHPQQTMRCAVHTHSKHQQRVHATWKPKETITHMLHQHTNVDTNGGNCDGRNND